MEDEARWNFADPARGAGPVSFADEASAPVAVMAQSILCRMMALAALVTAIVVLVLCLV